MTPEFAYFLKVNVAFVLLYAFYRLFFYKDTFFKLRRAILLAFFGLSLLYPLMNIQEWIKEQEPMAEVIQIYSSMLPEMEAIVITPEKTARMDWYSLFASYLSYIYWGGVVILFIRFLVQFGSIMFLAHKSRKTLLHGVPVHSLNKPAGPFSFFRLIFLHPESHSEKEIDEILTHECTHVFQWHSIDVIICELVNIICWVNPFAWLLKREVRHNLEYLADDTVLESGYDSRSYQYHLLGLAHHNKSTAALYNSFNVLHLKNRISMMNKKRSRGIGRTKYLFFIPVAACMMLLNNIDALARITNEIAEDVSVDSFLPQSDKVVKVSARLINESREPVAGANVIIDGSTTGTISDRNGMFVIEAPVNKTLRIISMNTKERKIDVKDIKDNLKIQLLDANSTVFTVVEKMPQFPGGQKALLNFLEREIKYPAQAEEEGIQGRVSCQFVVRKDGSISDPEIVRGIHPSLDAEALRVVKAMPDWTPGQQRGKNVSVKFTVPVIFRLPGQKTAQSSASSGKEMKRTDASGKIYTVVERMPEFPGGQSKLLKYLSANIKYPVIAQENGISGRVSCQFTVETDGSLSDIEIVRGVDEALDKEAKRVIAAMPKWNPGMQGDMAVKVKFTVPVIFRLQ